MDMIGSWRFVVPGRVGILHLSIGPACSGGKHLLVVPSQALVVTPTGSLLVRALPRPGRRYEPASAPECSTSRARLTKALTSGSGSGVRQASSRVAGSSPSTGTARMRRSAKSCMTVGIV